MGKRGLKRRSWNDPVIVARFRARCTPCACGCILFDNDNGKGWGRLVAYDFPGCAANRVLVHRYAWALVHGPPTADDDVHHLHDVCRHRNCVNPDHLEAIGHGPHASVSNDHKRKLAAEDAAAFEAGDQGFGD